jgi:AcrR family transcriptional regulator
MADNLQAKVRPWKAKQKEQLRQEIIAVAIQLFGEKGLGSVSVDEIAQQTGIAKGTFYLYFKSKADLIQSVLEKGLALLEEAVFSAIKHGEGDARADLKNVVRAQLGFFEEHGSIITLLVSGRGAAAGDLSAEVWEGLRIRYRAATTSIYEGIISRAIGTGAYRQVDAHLAASILYGIVSGLLYESVDSGRPFSCNLDIAFDVFEKGVNRIA